MTRDERMKHPDLYWAHAMEGVERYLWGEIEVTREEYEEAGGKAIPS
jgi:hypothetical protein